MQKICRDLGYNFEDFEEIITEENILTKKQKAESLKKLGKQLRIKTRMS